MYTINKIAIKNLWLHKLRTFLTVTGVAIGIGAIIFLVSLGYGLEKLVTQQVANFNAFTVIDVPTSSTKSVVIDDAIIEKMSEYGHVVKIAPVGSVAGRVNKVDSASSSEVVLIGATDEYWKMADATVTKGKLPKEVNEVVVNKPVITLLGETPESIVGKKIMVDMIIPTEVQVTGNNGDKVLKDDIEVTVSGYSDSDKESIVMTTLELLKKNGVDKYSALKVKVDNKTNIDITRRKIEGAGFDTEYVGDTVDQIQQVFSLLRVVMAAFGLIALIVAALGTFNTLTISLLERTREVGLFKALGMRNRDVYRMFLAESMIIGILGGFFGLILGIATGGILDSILVYFATQTGADQISVFSTPSIFILYVALFALFVGFVTGWYPARRAVKISPLDALRNE